MSEYCVNCEALAKRVEELEEMVGMLCPECIDDLKQKDAEITRLREALALANSMILSGEQHSEYSEKKIAQALRGEE